MEITEEMVRGTAPNSPCRDCVGKDCPYDGDLGSMKCRTLMEYCGEIEKRMENSEARLWQHHTTTE